ncbi:hypothetical protein [Streptomyces parvulus]|uniref:hypothetical protein n=1 Tax=Streptomyces parvulus TaxID=146923 RepID=UPI0037FFF3FF
MGLRDERIDHALAALQPDLRWDQEDDNRRIRSRTHTIGECFATEQPLLVPLTGQ